MRAFEIEEYFKNHKNFYGCFLNTELPIFPNEFPFYMIICNCKHFTAILGLKEDSCLYFDSFGVKNNIPSEIIEFLNQKYKNIIINLNQIQDFKSYKCAKFCLAFVENVYSIESYLVFLNKFDENKMINDCIVEKL